jgi:hypothetical protein
MQQAPKCRRTLDLNKSSRREIAVDWLPTAVPREMLPTQAVGCPGWASGTCHASRVPSLSSARSPGCILGDEFWAVSWGPIVPELLGAGGEDDSQGSDQMPEGTSMTLAMDRWPQESQHPCFNVHICTRLMRQEDGSCVPYQQWPVFECLLDMNLLYGHYSAGKNLLPVKACDNSCHVFCEQRLTCSFEYKNIKVKSKLLF